MAVPRMPRRSRWRCTPRTLNGRLSAEGTRFRTAANEIRFEIARQLLADTTFSFGQVAAVLDYSKASAFTRAFRRWSGQTRLGGRGTPEAV
jgi:AraC-like DNA-binding protein